MGCCSGFARFLLIFFNLIFWLSGVAILGVGIWILVDPDMDDYQKVIEDASSDGDFLKIGAYILIGFGAFVFLVGFCGCCGAIRKSKCLLGLYIFCLVLVFGGELAAGIYVAVKKGDVEDDLENGLKRSFDDHFKDLKTAWDVIQNKMDCCGPTGPKDYQNIDWDNKDNKNVPESCCKGNNMTKCQDEAFSSSGSAFVHQQGCNHELKEWVKDNSGYLMGVGIGIAALQIIGLVCAIIFCRNIEEMK